MLPVLYWVLGGLDILMSLYGLIYIGLGAVFAFTPWQSSGAASDAPPAFIGWFFVAIGVGFMLVFGASGGLKIATGFWISKRRRRTLSLVMAGVSCLWVPFGTLVGVLTFIVLLRPSVEALYAGAAVGEPPAPGEDEPAAV